jgi:hypothetical protein
MIKNYGMRGVFFLCVLVSSLFAEGPKNIVVIGWDGAQRAHVQEMITRNELPHLTALSKQGKLIDIDVTNGATDTKAGWTQILTGYSCDITGVYGNGRYQPIPEGYSVFERLETFFGPDNIATLAIIGKKGHVDNDAPRRIDYDKWQAAEEKQKKIDTKKPGLGNLQGGKIVEEGGKKYVDIPGKPWYTASRHMDLFVNGLLENKKVAARAMEELDKHKDKRFFMFVHFADPDHSGHKHGENSRQYSEAIADDDAWTGKIIARLKDLGLYESTLVYVVVDHGFNEGEKGHRYAPYVFLGTNDAAVMRDGDRMDIAPTILKRFGVNLSTLQPALSGKPLDEPAVRVIAPAENPNAPKRPTEAEKAKIADILNSDQPALERLKQVDVEKLTPVQAKRLLTDIKKEAAPSMKNAAQGVGASKD